MEPWSRFRQVEVPQIQYEDQVVQVPIQKQVQVPHVQTVQKTVEIPQIELLALNNLKYLGVLSVVGMHLLRALRVFLSALVVKVASHLRYVDKVVPIPVAKQVQVPMVSTATRPQTMKLPVSQQCKVQMTPLFLRCRRQLRFHRLSILQLGPNDSISRRPLLISMSNRENESK